MKSNCLIVCIILSIFSFNCNSMSPLENRALNIINKYCISRSSFSPAKGVYPFEGADYGMSIEGKLEQDKKYLVVLDMGNLLLFPNRDSRDPYEDDTLVNILTRGGGSCLFYAMDEINCDALRSIMFKSLQHDLQNFRNIDFTQRSKEDALELIYLNYEHNIFGVGLALEDAEKIIETSKHPTILYILPLKEETLKKQEAETGISIDELRTYDHIKERKFFNFESCQVADIRRILFHHGHFSRLVTNNEFCEIKKLQMLYKSFDLLEINYDN